MRRNRDAPSIGVSVALMRSFLTDEIESVAGESSDYFSGCDRPDAAVVDTHGLDGDGDARFLLGNLFDLHRTLRPFGQRFAVFDGFLDDHADNFVDAAQRFLSRASRGCGTDAFERRYVRKPRRVALGILVRLHDDFKVVGFHGCWYSLYPRLSSV